jgi:hypothetical protein
LLARAERRFDAMVPLEPMRQVHARVFKMDNAAVRRLYSPRGAVHEQWPHKQQPASANRTFDANARLSQAGHRNVA